MVISVCWIAAGQGGTREPSHRRGHKSDKVIVHPGLQCECKSTWWSALTGRNSSASCWYGMCPQTGGRGSPSSCLGTYTERGASGWAYAYVTIHPQPCEYHRAISEITAGWLQPTARSTTVQNVSFLVSDYLSAAQSICSLGKIQNRRLEHFARQDWVALAALPGSELGKVINAIFNFTQSECHSGEDLINTH